ncbi:hypothetical protein PX701_02495 [Agromyces sp. H3Y2-19a]|uniref:hypothetical protein n=1 Tax=Agromyces chromiiresistens TaxID=3030835 RepID=UPI0023B91D69|nr:hypothetical protein [Agromyces chromiiresistens]MDF0512482.1 hypothetical protein [Agromyces chromiiresistens]
MARIRPEHAAAAASLVLVLLSGCASGAVAPSSSPSPSPSPSGEGGRDPETILTCQGVEVTAGALDERTPASSLPSELAALLEDSPVVPIDDLDDWFVAVSSDDHVVLMRELEPPVDLGGGDVRDFDLFSASASPGAMPIDDVWGVDVSTSCTPRIDLGGRGEAMLALDPDALPDPGDREIAMLATERSCNSGRPATGRIEVIDVVETDTAVELVVGVVPNGDGAYTCQSNPPTPFTVALERELGDRVLLDASVVPAHEIVAPAAGADG